ncbi:hypothetical protein CGZ80_15475 [Rhodopirellula sp. MGV]|nr:hypothetical protein CGZ80_15475 [Rhodopirellula sp. MGV]PNY37494.1 DUF2752 domain-containing protein [Rhodopirellula baltica]
MFATPNASGLGTHQSLGLPPCSIRVLFGIRCPMCGMTTSWANLVRGQVWAAASASVTGCLLAFYSLYALFLAVQSAVLGMLPSPSQVRTATWVLIGIQLLIVAEWLYRLN